MDTFLEYESPPSKGDIARRWVVRGIIINSVALFIALAAFKAHWRYVDGPESTDLLETLGINEGSVVFYLCRRSAWVAPLPGIAFAIFALLSRPRLNAKAIVILISFAVVTWFAATVFVGVHILAAFPRPGS